MRGRGLGGVLALSLLAAACRQDEAAAPVVESDDTGARGEVLEGTISDRMIPYDELGRGDPPPAAIVGEEGAQPPERAGGAARRGVEAAGEPSAEAAEPAAEAADAEEVTEAAAEEE